MHGRCEGTLADRAARQRRLRLRPRLRPGRLPRRQPHDGGAHAAREGRDQPPRARRPRPGPPAARGRGGRAAGQPAPVALRRARRPAPGAAAMNETAGARDRQRTAASNVAAAVFLVAIKLVTGLVTGSLAFIAEAAHSATDLVAALLTLFAVRVAVRPPDREHHYGHGKAEHLAALGESAFLMLVSLFIALRVDRPAHRAAAGTHVDVTWWAFAVLGVVIVVDAPARITSLRASRRTGSAGARRQRAPLRVRPRRLARGAGRPAVRPRRPPGRGRGGRAVRRRARGRSRRCAWRRRSIDVLMDRAVADADERDPRRARSGRRGGRVAPRARPPRRRAQLRGPRRGRAARRRACARRTRSPTTIEDVVERALGGADVVVHVEPTEAEGDLRERATAAARRDPRGARGPQRARDAGCPTATSCRCT